MDLAPEAVVELVGAVTVAVTLISRGFLKRSQAVLKGAETTAAALEDLRTRLDSCEADHRARDAKDALQDKKIEHLERQLAANDEVIVGFSEKIESDAVLIRGLRARVADLEQVMKTGVRHGGSR